MINQGQKLGITTWTQPERYGLSLTLGGADVKMVDMAVVFGTLANQGLKINLHSILKVTDGQDKTLMDFSCQDIPKITLPEPRPEADGPMAQAYAATQHISCQPDPVLNPNIAYLLTDILSDTIARIPAFGSQSFLNIPNHQVAVKTGTSNDKRDNWTIGYTQDYLVAAWVGNNDNSPMSNVASGITGASPIWNKITTELLKDQPSHQFTPPQDLIKVNICTLTGQLSCQGCPTSTEYFIPGTEPKLHCKPEFIQELLEKKKEEEEKNHDQILTGASTD
jgi:membrane carboxypeptidase/penicillin-binding protein